MYGGPGFFEFVIWNLVPGLLEALVIFVAIYFGISFGIRKLFSLSGGESAAQDASEIIRGRYAKGEISRREFEQMREDLETERTNLSQAT